MNRRTLLKLSAVALTGSSVKAQPEAQRVARLENFPALWDLVEFEFGVKPAFVLRVPAPRTDLARARVLRVKPDFHLLGVLRECSHNGCAVTWSASNNKAAKTTISNRNRISLALRGRRSKLRIG